MKDKKLRVKQLTEQCNASKKDLDVVKAKLDAKAQEKKEQMQEDLQGLDDDEGGMN